MGAGEEGNECSTPSSGHSLYFHWHRTLTLEQSQESSRSIPLFYRDGTKAKKSQVSCLMSNKSHSSWPRASPKFFCSISGVLSQGQFCPSYGTSEIPEMFLTITGDCQNRLEAGDATKHLTMHTAGPNKDSPSPVGYPMSTGQRLRNPHLKFSQSNRSHTDQHLIRRRLVKYKAYWHMQESVNVIHTSGRDTSWLHSAL